MPIGKRTLIDLPGWANKFPVGHKKSGSNIAAEQAAKNPIMNDRLLWAASVGYRKVIKQKFSKISYRIVSWSKAHSHETV